MDIVITVNIPKEIKLEDDEQVLAFIDGLVNCLSNSKSHLFFDAGNGKVKSVEIKKLIKPDWEFYSLVSEINTKDKYDN